MANEKRQLSATSEATFVEGQSYHRQNDLHDQFGGNRQSGIAHCAKFPLVFLFTSPSGEEYGYQDDWRTEDKFVYTGEGQIGDMQMTPGNRAILNHIEDERELHLFKKVSQGQYEYVGQFVYDSHETRRAEDAEGKIRDVIQFVLKKL
jgi:5-methylcytosine-specific restriction enzyme A